MPSAYFYCILKIPRNKQSFSILSTLDLVNTMKIGNRKKALFLDRDGVINVNHGYVSRPEQVDWVPGIFDLVGKANQLDYLVIVLTNQSGIARGYYTEKTFWDLMQWMQTEFTVRGASLNHIYFCPHHPCAGFAPYVQFCKCRKPSVGMVKQAMEEYSIDLAQSIMVGDKPIDMQMATHASIGNGYLLTSCTLPPDSHPKTKNLDSSKTLIKTINHLNLIQLA